MEVRQWGVHGDVYRASGRSSTPRLFTRRRAVSVGGRRRVRLHSSASPLHRSEKRLMRSPSKELSSEYWLVVTHICMLNMLLYTSARCLNSPPLLPGTRSTSQDTLEVVSQISPALSRSPRCPRTQIGASRHVPFTSRFRDLVARSSLQVV